MVKISRDSSGPASPASPLDLARRPAHRRVAGPRDGAAQFLRHLDPHRSGAGDAASGSAAASRSSAPGAWSPGAPPRELPPLDLVLLSHAHMDHTDLGTLRSLRRDVPVVVQHGNRDLVRRFRRVEELGWGESAEVDGDHGGIGRGAPLGRPDGDRPAPGVRRVPAEPEGAAPCSSPATPPTPTRSHRLGARGAGRSRHPADRRLRPLDRQPRLARAGLADVAGLGARYLLPMHHSTFRLSREPVEEPVERLLAAAGTESWRIVAEIGETWSLRRMACDPVTG